MDDKRIVDSSGNEALVTAALDALKVHLIDAAGVTIEDLETAINNLQSALNPVTLETGGGDEGTFTRGFIAETEVLDIRTDNIAPGGIDTITTYTVPAGNTLHITGYWISDTTVSTSGEFIGRMKLDATIVHQSRAASGDGIHINFIQPIKALAEVVVDVDMYHWMNTNRTIFAGIHGFLTVDSELD